MSRPADFGTPAFEAKLQEFRAKDAKREAERDLTPADVDNYIRGGITNA